MPDGTAFVAASSDLNVSKYVTTTLTAFLRDGTAHVLWYRFRKCRIPTTLAQVEYNRRVVQLLTEHGRELKALGVRIDGWAIDGNGVPMEAVQSFCRASSRACGLPAACFIGKASHVFSGQVRSRLRDEVRMTVLCGDAAEHAQPGTGRRYTYWNSDYYREAVQKAFLQPPGAAGCCTLYLGGSESHAEFAVQICAERLKLKKQQQDGRFLYYWKSSVDHDALDSLAQGFALFNSMNIGVQASQAPASALRKRLFRRKLRIV